MKPFLRFAWILAASAAFPACMSAQNSGGVVLGPPAPAALSATGLAISSGRGSLFNNGDGTRRRM